MADYAVMARACGARVIGGCCGTTPDHLRAMRTALDTRQMDHPPSLEEVTEALGAFSSSSDGTGEEATPKRTRRGRRRAA